MVASFTDRPGSRFSWFISAREILRLIIVEFCIVYSALPSLWNTAVLLTSCLLLWNVISSRRKVDTSTVSENVRNSWLELKSKSKAMSLGGVVSSVKSKTSCASVVFNSTTGFPIMSRIAPFSIARYVVFSELAKVYSRLISSESSFENIKLTIVESS